MFTPSRGTTVRNGLAAGDLVLGDWPCGRFPQRRKTPLVLAARSTSIRRGCDPAVPRRRDGVPNGSADLPDRRACRLDALRQPFPKDYRRRPQEPDFTQCQLSGAGRPTQGPLPSDSYAAAGKRNPVPCMPIKGGNGRGGGPPGRASHPFSPEEWSEYGAAPCGRLRVTVLN